MRLKDLAKSELPATDNLAVRIDKKTMGEIQSYRQQYGKKVVAQWLRDQIRKAVESERLETKRTA